MLIKLKTKQLMSKSDKVFCFRLTDHDYYLIWVPSTVSDFVYA
jgi:hypothetical protein